MKELQRSLLLFVSMLVITALVYFLLLAPSTRQLSRERQETEKMRKVSEQYNNVAQFNQQLDGQRKQTSELIGRYAIYLSSAGARSDQEFWQDIERVSEQAGIKPDRTSPVQGGDRRGWTVSLTTSYDRLITFLHLLERSFKVEELSVQRTAPGVITADLVIFPINVQYSDNDGGCRDFVELFNQTVQLAQAIDAKPAARLETKLSARDPFMITEPKKNPGVSPGKRVPPLPYVRVDGIFFDSDTPLVSIDGKLLREGSVYKGITIQKIRKTAVAALWAGRVQTLKISKSEESRPTGEEELQ